MKRLKQLLYWTTWKPSLWTKHRSFKLKYHTISLDHYKTFFHRYEFLPWLCEITFFRRLLLTAFKLGTRPRRKCQYHPFYDKYIGTYWRAFNSVQNKMYNVTISVLRPTLAAGRCLFVRRPPSSKICEFKWALSL